MSTWHAGSAIPRPSLCLQCLAGALTESRARCRLAVDATPSVETIRNSDDRRATQLKLLSSRETRSHA